MNEEDNKEEVAVEEKAAPVETPRPKRTVRSRRKPVAPAPEGAEAPAPSPEPSAVPEKAPVAQEPAREEEKKASLPPPPPRIPFVGKPRLPEVWEPGANRDASSEQQPENKPANSSPQPPSSEKPVASVSPAPDASTDSVSRQQDSAEPSQSNAQEGEPAPNGEYQSPRAERMAKWGRFKHGRDRFRNRRDRFRSDGTPDAEGNPPHNPEGSGEQLPREERPQLPPIYLRELECMSIEELNEKLTGFFSPEEIAGTYRRHDVINDYVRAYLRRGGTVITNGVIEIMSDGFGFLRSEKASYLACPEDVYVAPNYVRRFNLRTGDFVEGPIRDPRERGERGKEKFLALGRIESVNGLPPAEWRRIIPFENLTPIFPTRRIQLERLAPGLEPTDISMRFVDLFAPIGFGQRGLIVAPPRTGKTVLLQKVANAITANYPDAYLMVLLIDERPEEVTDMERNTSAHVLASTFDEAPERHAQVAEMAIEMAKRKVESGKDVIILLDSITRLARAYNTLAPHSGKILSGGVDANAMFKPKRFFGAARNIENGGSLTIIATALIETGSRMDEVIFEEFKGTGNMELVLDRQYSDRRIFPAINVNASGTRKEELIVNPAELNIARWLRNMLNDSTTPVDSMDNVIKHMKKYSCNADFIMQKLNKGDSLL